MGGRWFAVILAAGGLAALAVPALACSCVEPGPPLVEFDRSSAVFVGYVQSVEPLSPLESLAQVRVTGAWKGVTRHVVQIYSDPLCGYQFVESEEYVIYAHRADTPCCGEDYAVTLCSRTRLSSRAGEDFAALGDPTPVETGSTHWGRVKALFGGSTPQSSRPLPQTQGRLVP